MAISSGLTNAGWPRWLWSPIVGSDPRWGRTQVTPLTIRHTTSCNPSSSPSFSPTPPGITPLSRQCASNSIELGLEAGLPHIPSAAAESIARDGGDEMAFVDQREDRLTCRLERPHLNVYDLYSVSVPKKEVQDRLMNRSGFLIRNIQRRFAVQKRWPGVDLEY